MVDALQALELVNRFGVLGLGAITGFGFWWIDRRMQVLSADFKNLARQLQTHTEHDREDFARLHDRLDEKGRR